MSNKDSVTMIEWISDSAVLLHWGTTTQHTTNPDNKAPWWIGPNNIGYLLGDKKPRYPSPAIVIETTIDHDVVFQSWQYAIATNGAPLNMGRCLAGDYYVMCNYWRRF